MTLTLEKASIIIPLCPTLDRRAIIKPSPLVLQMEKTPQLGSALLLLLKIVDFILRLGQFFRRRSPLSSLPRSKLN